MVYLVTFSLVLHLVSFFIMIILYQKIENSQPPDTERTLKEMEDMLISYTTEVKEDNERLARRINNIDHVREQGMSPPPQTATIQNTNTPTSKDEEKTGDEPGDDQEYTAYMPPLPEEKDAPETSFVSSETSRVLSMYDQGFSEADIAREVGIGAGEVNLLLKFHK